MYERILVIEDEPEWYDVLREILEEQRYVVEVATTRREAKERLLAGRHDLIISDACVDRATFDLECQQFLNFLRQSRPDVPLMALTGKPINPAEMWTLFQMKVVDFIYKPNLSLPDLCRRVREALQAKAPDPLQFPNSEVDKPEFAYHVFISYSRLDQDWVRDWLLQRLAAAGLKVCVDFNCFEPGAPLIDEIERAVIQSCKTLPVLTPAYFKSEWAGFENILAQTRDPAARRRRLLPLLLKPCELPPRLGAINYLDFTAPEQHEPQLRRLLKAVEAECRPCPRDVGVNEGSED